MCGQSAHAVAAALYRTAGMRGGGTGGRSRLHKVGALLLRSSLTHTLRPADVGGVARLAGAAVGAQRVDTLTVPAQVAHHLTLVDIWVENKRHQIFHFLCLISFHVFFFPYYYTCLGHIFDVFCASTVLKVVNIKKQVQTFDWSCVSIKKKLHSYSFVFSFRVKDETLLKNVVKLA